MGEFQQVTRNAVDMGATSPGFDVQTGVVLDANGLASITFSVPFKTKPFVGIMAEDTTQTLAGAKVTGWTMDGNGNFAGCSIACRVTRPLPAVLTLLTALISYDTTAPAAGMVVATLGAGGQ